MGAASDGVGADGQDAGDAGELEAYRREIERSSQGRKTVLLMAALGGILGGRSRAGSLRRLESAASTLLATLPDSAELGHGEGAGPAGASGR